MSLFQTSVVKKYLSNLSPELIDKKYNDFHTYFGNPEIQENIRNLKEEEFQEGFIRELFVNIFDYTLKPNANFNIELEKKNVDDSKKADGAILLNNEVHAVIELKSTQTTDLDSVETQAFGYKNHNPKCVYVITSNFEKIRIYIQNAIDHLEFDLFNLNKEDFSLLWLCLSKDNILNDIPLKIKESSVLQEESVTKKLYNDYSKFRTEIFDDIVKNNPDSDKLVLFKKTQKLLDRFLFILFAEDRNLLPPNSVSRIVERWNILKREDAYKPLYDIFKQYFGYLNKGRKGQVPDDDIFSYNGGLFVSDEILDNIKISDELLHKHTLQLSSYDFETDVDVNILGHIFEHSLSEIENVQAEIAGKTVDQQKSKRKKDGIFYTPKYITKYIVENTIGKLCEEKRAELNIIDEEYAKGRKNRKKEIVKELDNKLTEYREWLLNITILDPACGSGAFLNQALEFLIQEHKKIDELKAQLLGGSIVFSDIEARILEKNIYGVDLNEESVEIAKLSLWLRTAQKGRKLTALSNHIKCGNSLIDDPEIAGEKAFSWQKEFPEVFLNGGFDVVIGNPPYGDYFSKQEKEYLLTKYSNSFSGTFDMYIMFFEISLHLVRTNGKLCFITPNTFLDYAQFSGLRKILLEHNNIEQIIDLVGVFDDAIVDTAIIQLTKGKKQDINFKGKEFKDKVISINSSEIPFIDSVNISERGFILKSNEKFNIHHFIKQFNSKLGDKIKITQGITTGGNECFINSKEHFLNNGIPESAIKKTLKGKTINRYRILFDGDYILYSTKSLEEAIQNNIAVLLSDFKEKLSKKRETEQGKLPWYCLHWARDEKDFNEPKILIRQTASNIIGVLDINNYYPIDTIHTLNLYSNDVNKEKYLLFLLGILNSSLVKYLYQWKMDEAGKVYPQVKKVNIEWIPIPEYMEDELISAKVNSIQNIFSSLEELRFKFLRYLNSKYKNISDNSTLQNWIDIEFSSFTETLNKELKKNSGKILSKSDELEWMDIFDNKKEEVIKLKSEIDKTDKEIDQMVYALYGLTEEEIKIIESSIYG